MESNELKKTVLLVDDAPSNIQVVNSILKDLYKIRIATNGPKALELVKVAPPPDLILLDVLMPGMDGYEVCTRLKADPETKDIPVIFLTGQTETQDETRGFEVGAVDYIHKPFSPAVVKARVQTHLVLRGIREQLAQQLLAIQKELETARLIQQSILPESVPQIDGLDIAARYVPMTSVAGDFYDFIVVDNRHVGILVADGLNKALCGKFQHHYVTAAYVFLDMEKRRLTYAGAGHPPLLLFGGSSNGVRDIAENGLFLGKFDFAAYTSVEVPLAAGDFGLLYTDGVSETNSPDHVEFGSERFRQFLASERSPSADQLADRLLNELSDWSARGEGEDLDDDLTLVAFHVKAPGRTA